MTTALGVLGVGAIYAVLVWSPWGQSGSQTGAVAKSNSPEPAYVDPRTPACTTGLTSRRAEAKAAFAKKDYEGAWRLMDHCDYLFKPETEEKKEFLTYLFAYEKQMDAEKKVSDKAEKAAKKKEGVRIGMGQQDVLDSSWGRPNKVNKTTTAYGVREQWVYGGGYLYFENGVLTSIQN